MLIYQKSSPALKSNNGLGKLVRFIAKHSRAARRLDTKNGKGRFVRKSAIEFARFGFTTTFDFTKKLIKKLHLLIRRI